MTQEACDALSPVGEPELGPNQYLQQRRQGWYVRVAVPPPLVGKVGKRSIIRSLQTRDVRVARDRRWAAVCEIKRELAQLRGAETWDPIKRGTQLRSRYQQTDPLPIGDRSNPDPELQDRWEASERAEVRLDVLADVDALRDAGRDEEAAQLYRIATAEEATLSIDRDRWLAEVGPTLAGTTVLQHKLAFRTLTEVFPAAMLVSDIDRRKAGQFVDALRQKGLSDKTVNRYLSSLQSFWKWAARKGLSDQSPWGGQGNYSGKRPRREERHRPYTGAELVALLSADPIAYRGRRYGSAIRDLLRLGLMTGMRITEMCELRTEDVLVADRAVRVQAGKTDAARRTIPVHAAAWSVVERRTANAIDGQLFPELNPGGPDAKRSFTVTKRFTDFRREVLGLDDTVDFHSLRRSFATYLEHASTKSNKANAQVIAQLMGHTKSGLALSLYSGGLLIQHLRDAIDLLSEVIEPKVLAALPIDVATIRPGG